MHCCDPTQSLTGLVEGTDAPLLQKIAQASIALYREVALTLRASSTPGQQHYLFSLTHLETALQVYICQREILHYVLYILTGPVLPT